MSQITHTPDVVTDAVNRLEDSLLGAETQVFWGEFGAVVLTDEAVYEVYVSGDELYIQQGTLEKVRGWEDVTAEVK